MPRLRGEALPHEPTDVRIETAPSPCERFHLLVEQSEYGTNRPYLVDFIKITFAAKLLNVEEIRAQYTQKGLSAAQIARQHGVAKSVILARLGDLGIRGGAGASRSTNPENYRCRIAPYGYSIQAGRLVPNKAELRICRQVVDL